MILIIGGNGQLGHDFQRLFKEKNIEFIATGSKKLDVTNTESIYSFVEGKKITLIINCAAYNNVDKAEEEKEICYKLNAYAPRDLALIAKEIGADYITYSTDFVFDGTKKEPYTEQDISNPLNNYSKAKKLGESLVLESYEKSFVIRTSWVFGVGNNNFVKQVINWSKTKNIISIVDDQISAPTYSYDLAKYSWELIKTKKYGLYHLSNKGIVSKYEQAKYILNSINWKGILKRGKTSDFNLLAKRPQYTKLDSTKVEKTIGQELPTWESGIDKYLIEMKNLGGI